MFASRSITRHLLRGLMGFGALALAMLLLDPHPGWSLVALGFALVALRGCPMCWTLGLLETATARRRGAAPRCNDGSCATAWPREP